MADMNYRYAEPSDYDAANLAKKTATADRVAMRLALGIVGPEYPIENVRSCANDLLGLGLRAAVEHQIYGKAYHGCPCCKKSLTALLGEGEKLRDVEAKWHGEQ